MESVGSPILLLEPNKATVELSVLLQVFIKHRDGSIINLLLLKAVSGTRGAQAASRDGVVAWADPLTVCLQDLSLNVRLSISRSSLMLAFSLGR